MSKFYELVDVIKKLRAPDGCPWDREQTLETLKPHLLEETYEVLEAMDKGGDELKGELGDLLLQVVFQSNISEEKGEFNIDDVVDSIKNKMIRRHPHVFQDSSLAETSEEVLINWEKIKMSEKEHSNRKSILDGKTKGLPALMVSEKMQKKASKVGFDWPDISGVIDKVEEEIDELRDEIMSDKIESIEEELGDLFFAMVNLARHLNINPELCLNKASKKFDERFRYIEGKCNLEEATLEDMDNLWEEAKKIKKNF